MTDRTSGPGGDRHRTERFTRPQGDEWTPEQESPDRDEWSPGDAFPAHRTPREPRPDERLPGEPAPRTSPARGSAEGTGGRLTGADPSGGAPGGSTGDRPAAEEAARGRDLGTEASGTAQGADGGGRPAWAAGPGKEGLTGDDRAPEETPPPPGPAGAPEGGRRPESEPAPRHEHGSEGLRPGTEDLASQTPGSGRRGPDASAEPGGQGGRIAGAGSVDEDGIMPDDGLGAPAVGAASGREARTANGRGTDSWPTAPATATAPSGTGAPLLPHEETDQWEHRLREVAVGFVDDPREAVEEADRALEEITARFTEAVTRRRRTLRMSWQETEARDPGAEADTEQLRLALRDYRELAGRLLHG
ncbi:hypothetical protein [Streptomyces cyanogenus]|uniref:Uncharacterized protein n=1 Tax=Streptomyces cyanogenus TaxID=80860 RepID=A0ABX7TNU0_STRCY|nr:hypothetical protein [Streptomyces cyanogenus]QTD98276.1 hypothetical protein S1361_13015 [Streptomyces cyanogenus]